MEPYFYYWLAKALLPDQHLKRINKEPDSQEHFTAIDLTTLKT